MHPAATVACCLAALVGGLAWTSAQDAPSGAEAGHLAFNNACRTCHTLREGDNRLGPSLYNVMGRKAGSLPGYGFSSAMKDAGLTWDQANLDRFIANPDEVVPGHNMKPFGGIASPEERAKIIAYLEKAGAGN
jgi:cytochrome c